MDTHTHSNAHHCKYTLAQQLVVMEQVKICWVTDLELVGCLLELNLELHHGGGPAGADDGSERHDGGHRLRGLGLAAPEVELLDHASGAPGGGGRSVGRIRRRSRIATGGGGRSGGGVREPVTGDDGVVLRARLVVGGNGRRDGARVRVLGGVGLHGKEGREGEEQDESEGVAP